MVGSRREGGYVALLAVLIVGAAATAIGILLLTTGVDSGRVALVDQRSKQARAAAVACTEEALQQVHDNIGFSGSNSLTLAPADCTYTVTVTAATTRTITTTATIGDVVRKTQVYVTIGTSTISITSWQEVG